MRALVRLRSAVIALGVAVAVVYAGPAQPAARAGSLTDDGRVGVVTDVQGTALVRPAGRARWSPVGPRSVLLPGDDVRTMARGAHAAEVRLADGGSLVLGPGGLAHLEARARLRLMQGDVEVAATAGHPITVTGPGGFETRVEKTTVLRADDRTTTALTEPPRWLTGWRASTTDEWMGSLVATVDGRNVPLSVGYHKVGVTIRDQIAETTVEESFVNSTDGTLEGVFSFPLPADASISGFGMWIGEELVEADIVERERARAIYEDIRSRRKDPGLLEWSGGNLFKASVFPIFPHSEKRVRLRYTQVLPLEGTLVRYRYALRSELLRTHPLRELRIDVSAQSAAPIVSASSPTHEVRVTQTAHAATVAFSASEFTPDRDFEVVLGLETTSPLRAVPHRRGDDGYLMLLFAPPDASAGAWKRDLVPEGTPLDVVFVADTSGSMGPPERAAQRSFIESMLALLGPDDRFRLMACDANVVWLADESLPATDANTARAMEFLGHRVSLGWSDIDGALAAAIGRASSNTLIVYVGDAIGTTGDADPVALAQRIGRMTLPVGAAVHAVSAGSSFEQGVLQAMAARGGGSVRSAGDDPARAALSLLTEIAQPALKDLRVAFEGLRTARVYPERLPNLAAGTQQIVLGRFLPEGDTEQRGRVTVTGSLGGNPVSYSADIAVAPGAEGTGNSFLPRLWARRHLDALLAEGRTPAIRDEVVAMSESYGIITPYTSFLVLENDEDRERYGVTRRVAMRDGERFFTDARGTAATAVLREEMQKARSWRLDLRRAMLAEISGLGRGLALGPEYGYAVGGIGGLGQGGGGGGGGRRRIPGARFGYYRPRDEVSAKEEWSTQTASDFRDWSDLDFESDGSSEAVPPDSREPASEEERNEAFAPEESRGNSLDEEASGDDGRREFAGAFAKKARAARSLTGAKSWRGDTGVDLGKELMGQGLQLLQQFPQIDVRPPRVVTPPPVRWDAEVVTLLASVASASDAAHPAEGRVDVAWRELSVVPAGQEEFPPTSGRALVAAERWFVRRRMPAVEPIDEWFAQDRGVIATGRGLGRRRPAVDGDRDAWRPLLGRMTIDFAASYGAWTAKVESREGTLVVVAFTAPGAARDRLLVTIDTQGDVVVLQRWFQGEELTGSHRRSGFLRAGGLWWATEEAQLDADGHETWRRTLTVRELPPAEFDGALAAALSVQESAIFLGAADPSLVVAKQVVHEGRGGFADLLVIAADHSLRQRWDDAWDAWEKARALVESPDRRRPGADWIEAVLLSMSRRGERFSAHLHALAETIVKNGGPAAYALARQIDQLAQNGLESNERLTLLDVLERATDVAAEPSERSWQSTFWQQQRAALLASAGRHAEAVAVWRTLRQAKPDDFQRALTLMYGLVNAEDIDGAFELFRAVDLAKAGVQPYQVQQLATLVVNLLWGAGRFERVIEVADRWIAAQPGEGAAYQARVSPLFALGRIDEFERWIGDHLALPAAEARDAPAVAQLQAAVRLALGDDLAGRWNGGASDPKWVRPLTDLARAAARDPSIDLGLVAGIVSDSRWQQTDGHRDLLAGLRDDLAAAGAIESRPAPRLVQVLQWLDWRRNAGDAAVWRGVTDRVEARLRAAKDGDERRVLLAGVLTLLDQHLEPDEAVRVLRDELTAAETKRVPEVASEFLTRLVRTPWSQAMEDEAFAVVPRLVTDEMPAVSRRSQLAATARWIVERLSTVRIESALPPKAERERLLRAELKSRESTARTATRKALASRLAVEGKRAPEFLRTWYEIERLGLAAEVGDDAKAVEADARELLLSVPESGDAASESIDVPFAAAERLTWIVRERCVLVLTYLAVRRDAPEGLADRVLALLRERTAKDEKVFDWRYATFRLLVALDRAEELESSLRAWIVPSQVESRWRRALGRLLAETGRLKEAADEFEAVARLDELGEADYAVLATWYLALGDDVRRDDASERRYAQVDEWVLNSRVARERNRVESRGPDGVPRTMDDEILRVVRALLVKASRPDNVVYNVRGLYGAVKDFRILASLADGVVGHTPEGIYPFLLSVGSILANVHEEAACDEVRARLEERMATARTDTDRRALALLMVLVERRAAEVLNRPGTHAARALDDLRKARQGTWLPGERRHMAEFLASLGKIPDEALAAEQAVQLKELHAAETPGSAGRLRIAHALFRTSWTYGRGDEAIDGLAVALDEFRQANGGLLPAETNDLAAALTDWQEVRGRFGAGEAWLDAEAARQTAPTQQQWYARRTFQLWVKCLEKSGTVSLGAGADLYRAAREKMERALADHLPDQLAEVLQSYCALHRVAHRAAKVEGAGDDLVKFSRTLLPEVLPRFAQQGIEQARQVAETLRDVSGPLVGLTLLVERLELEPSWRSMRGRGFGAWQNYGHRVAEWRREAPVLGPLEPRLLAVVLRELERDLLSEDNQGRHVYERNNSTFWAEKADEFAAVARRVIAANPEAPGRLRHTAEYLWSGLDRKDEAIATLEEAGRRGALREDGRFVLAKWHLELQHFASALPHAERLVADRPDNLAYRLVNIRALHGVGKDDAGRELVDASRAHFADLVARGQPASGASWQLADVSLECGWFDRAAVLYPEALSERRRTFRGGGGDSELSRLHGGLARSLAGLGRYDEAVDAASSAVVSWGPSGSSREEALRSLHDVLAAIPDLTAWTARWEAAAATSGMDAPVVRLTLAKLHLDRKEADEALRHLVAARRLTPDDVEVHAAIVAAFELKEDEAGLCDALATSLHHLPDQPDLYVRLADCLNGLGRADDAERALTGLVEYAPNEAEGHRRLAVARSKAARHDDAAEQWRQVVRIRSTELPGWLELARSLARGGHKAEAHAVLDDVLKTTWGVGQRKAVEKVSREIGKR